LFTSRKGTTKSVVKRLCIRVQIGCARIDRLHGRYTYGARRAARNVPVYQ